MEIWKAIPGYEGLYEVSDFGRVKRIAGYKCKVDRVLKNKVTKDGYYETALCNGKKYKYIRTHRIVADVFCSNPQNKPEVNHKDGNKHNNRAENLEWVTPSENQKHAYRFGLHKVSGGAISNRKKIRCLELGVETDSLHAMQRELCKRGFTKSTRINRLSEIMNNGVKVYRGLHFEFIGGNANGI